MNISEEHKKHQNKFYSLNICPLCGGGCIRGNFESSCDTCGFYIYTHVDSKNYMFSYFLDLNNKTYFIRVFSDCINFYYDDVSLDFPLYKINDCEDAERLIKKFVLLTSIS